MFHSPIARLTLIAPVAVTLLTLPLPAAAQTAQKMFRVGHVAAGGRTADGLPPRRIRETSEGSAIPRARTSRTRRASRKAVSNGFRT